MARTGSGAHDWHRFDIETRNGVRREVSINSNSWGLLFPAGQKHHDGCTAPSLYNATFARRLVRAFVFFSYIRSPSHSKSRDDVIQSSHLRDTVLRYHVFTTADCPAPILRNSGLRASLTIHGTVIKERQ